MGQDYLDRLEGDSFNFEAIYSLYMYLEILTHFYHFYFYMAFSQKFREGFAGWSGVRNVVELFSKINGKFFKKTPVIFVKDTVSVDVGSKS